ncbi:hypothetical protein RUND412_010303 [Rhizina undulata]
MVEGIIIQVAFSRGIQVVVEGQQKDVLGMLHDSNRSRVKFECYAGGGRWSSYGGDRSGEEVEG